MDEIVEIKLRGTAAELMKILQFVDSMRGGTPAVVNGPDVVAARTSPDPSLPGNDIPPPPPPPPGESRPTTSAAVTAQSAGRSTGQSPVTAPAGEGMRDSRGVIWHPEHHGGTAKKPVTVAGGKWSRRRGHNAEKLEAYEAQFIGSGGGNTANASGPNGGTVQQTTAVSGGIAEALAQMPTNGADIPPPPPPPVQAPPAGAPGYHDFAELWTNLLKAGRVDERHLAWLMTTFGSHPIMDREGQNVFKSDPVIRLQAYNELLKYRV